MKIQAFMNDVSNLIRECSSGEKKGAKRGRPLSGKEKWMLMLLLGLLAAVIILPGGKKNEQAGKERMSEQSSRLSAFDIQSGVNTQANTSNQNAEEEKSDISEDMSVAQYEQYLSQQLKHVLAQMEGVGRVEAWVTLYSGSEAVLYEEKDSSYTKLEEADSVGGIRKEENNESDKKVVMDSEGNPYVIKTLQPKVEGVLVIAEGAGNSTTKKNISEAVQVLFGIEAHRIKVAKKKVEE